MELIFATSDCEYGTHYMTNASPSAIFDKVFVVHLESQSERRAHIEREFHEIGINEYTLFPAIPADDRAVLSLHLSDRVKKYPSCFRCGKSHCSCLNNVLIRPQIANWISFLGVFNEAVAHNYEFCLVCEDNVTFMDYAPTAMRALKSHNRIQTALKDNEPLLVRMGYPGYDSEVHNYDGDVEFTQTRSMSNSCFAFNLTFAKHVLNTVKSISHTSDVAIHSQVITPKVIHYTMQPPPAFGLSQSKQIASAIHPRGVDAADSQRDRTHVKRVTSKTGLASVFGGNFGDLIGPYLFKKITGITPEIITINNLEIRDAIEHRHYLAVGSILKHATPYSQLWGIGIMNEDDTKKISGKLREKNVFAVRGPRTQKALIDAGLLPPGTPIANGDPGMLLPLVFKPASSKKYKIGITPHCTEYDAVRKQYENSDAVNVIKLGDVGTYENIESVIEQIVTCDKIVSSSLHGIIIAHVYGVPAAWRCFTPITANGAMGTTHLKFFDYFESINITDASPQLQEDTVINLRSEDFSLPEKHLVSQMQSILLRFCPFNIFGYTCDELNDVVGEGIELEPINPHTAAMNRHNTVRPQQHNDLHSLPQTTHQRGDRLGEFFHRVRSALK